MSFNHIGNYTCVCGKTFNNSQAYNGHKGNCKIYLESKGKFNPVEYTERQKRASEAAQNKRKLNAELNKLNKQLEWESTTHYCEKCGKELSKDFSKIIGTGRFCSRACANSRDHTTETKQKISKGVNDTNRSKGKRVIKDIPKQYCLLCGEELGLDNSSGYCRNCYHIAPELHDKRSESSKKGAQARIENGTQVSWQSRNIPVYTETFWSKVLENNNIRYEGPNKPVRKADGKNNYFLDFYIEKNNNKIDLEIDGKQHNYEDRKEHDIIRDKYLTSLGYIVYRIPWNEINTDSGKALMKNKIDKFIAFYDNL